jgi:hypothetical protein
MNPHSFLPLVFTKQKIAENSTLYLGESFGEQFLNSSEVTKVIFGRRNCSKKKSGNVEALHVAVTRSLGNVIVC